MCFLTLRAGTGDSADWMVNRMLKRVIVGALLILLFISVLALGGWYQCVVVSLAALLSVYELYHAFRQSGRAIFVMPAVMIVRFLQSLDGGAPAPEPLAQGIGADALGAESRS